MVGHNFGKVAGVNLCGFDSRLLRLGDSDLPQPAIPLFWQLVTFCGQVRKKG